MTNLKTSVAWEGTMLLLALVPSDGIPPEVSEFNGGVNLDWEASERRLTLNVLDNRDESVDFVKVTKEASLEEVGYQPVKPLSKHEHGDIKSLDHFISLIEWVNG